MRGLIGVIGKFMVMLHNSVNFSKSADLYTVLKDSPVREGLTEVTSGRLEGGEGANREDT